MSKLDVLKCVTDLFSFKIISDPLGNDYVVYKSSPMETIDHVDDKTAFEALENHVHLVNRVRLKDYELLLEIGENLGKALLFALEKSYPEKSFVVFVSFTMGEAMIIRFHQKWENEPYYFDVSNWDVPNTKILKFES